MRGFKVLIYVQAGKNNKAIGVVRKTKQRKSTK
jgi:hypothetical protein